MENVVSTGPSLASVSSGPRLDGIDVARAVAIGGMLLAHFVVSGSDGDAGWLQALDNAADGRSAPLFCVLLGVGCGLLTRRRDPERVLMLRGLVLLAMGLAVWPFVSRVYLILPHYAVLLIVLAILSSRVRTRWLLPLAACAWVLPSVAVALVDGHGLRSSPQPDTYGELLNLSSVAWHVAWTGGYPLVGWSGFALAGLWLARHELDSRRVQARLLAAGIAIALLQPVAALAFAALDGSTNSPDARGVAAFLDTSAHSNQTAWYLVSAGTAISVIALCLRICPLLRPSRPVAELGRQSLSAYLLHLLVGGVFVWDWRESTDPSLSSQVVVAAATFGALLLLANLWARRFRRGPLETVLRAVAP